MESTNRIFPSEAGTASEPIDLTMDSFRPVEPTLRPRIDSKPAPREDRLPYAWQDPCGTTRVVITTPGGSYESDNFHIDDEMGEIIIDANGTASCWTVGTSSYTWIPSIPRFIGTPYVTLRLPQEQKRPVKRPDAGGEGIITQERGDTMGAATRFIQNPGNNAICYYRYSSDAQRDVSIVQQKDAAHEYAKARGYHIIKEYDDPAYSGTRDDRPAFRMMLYEVEKLRPAYLILWKTDRLSRDRIDAVIAKKRLRECGVKIVYVAESIPDDDEATQILMESIYEAMAASFIVSHRKNVVRGMTYNAENALYNGIKMLGYVGEVDHKYEIDQATAPTVRRIFKEYTEGVPMQKICDSLNNAGQKTVRGNRFTVNSLRNILVNRAYIGEYKFGKILIPDGMPRLIDNETFQKAQSPLEANKRGGKGAIKKLHPEIAIEDYWLTGKIYCGLCGGTMQGVSGTSKRGALYYYYSCINYRKHNCKLKYQRKELMEKIVLYTLDDLINDPALRIVIAEKWNMSKKSTKGRGGSSSSQTICLPMRWSREKNLSSWRDPRHFKRFSMIRSQRR